MVVWGIAATPFAVFSLSALFAIAMRIWAIGMSPPMPFKSKMNKQLTVDEASPRSQAEGTVLHRVFRRRFKNRVTILKNSHRLIPWRLFVVEYERGTVLGSAGQDINQL